MLRAVGIGVSTHTFLNDEARTLETRAPETYDDNDY